MKNECTDIKGYKSALKEIYKLNLRRSSKFNILAILGALRCVNKSILSKNTGIYIGSEYSSMNSVKKVLEEISTDSIIMPFDFLNINSNNVSFYVSQALESKGKNMLLTSADLSFERGLEMALFDLEINEVEDALVGLVDESLDNIKEYQKYLSNKSGNSSNDYSGWLYMNKTEVNSLCKIESINSFSSISELSNLLNPLDFEMIYYNSECVLELLGIEIEGKSKKNMICLSSIINFIESKYKRMVYVGIDTKTKGYIFSINK